MVEKTMYQLRYCEVWDEYWYSGDIYETEADAYAAGKDLDQEEYTWYVDPVTVYLRNTHAARRAYQDGSLPL